ncbi:MAG: phosphoribosylaminoimidazolesuccinocarboxamide synthase [Candidatus Bathyarchaeia archaeon]|jgi:phosphoribosylaminoimidazole-succinocarboxamide synthase
MGSVKDLETVKKPTKNALGVGRFHFSDRYSVFDWGEMPDQIENKGAALCIVGAYCFEKLQERGIKTHYRGLVDKRGKAVTVEELKQPTSIMEIDLVNVFRPKAVMKDGRLHYNYRMYTPNLRNFLIPLEIIYRNGLPEGSSVFKRLEEGVITIETLGLDHYPMPGERLSKPIFDVSTKLEEADRYLTCDEAREIAGLTVEEVEDVKALLLRVNKMITQIALKADLENEDGKIELAFDPERKLMVVDVVGTLDECRFTYDGLHVSKETARQFYRKTDWYKDVEEAKKRAEREGVKDWKKLCTSKPPKLDPSLKKAISEMYMAVADELTETRIFDVPSLAEIVERYRS